MAKNQSVQQSEYNNEVEMVGTYAGGVLGGLSLGVFGDLLQTEINTMAFYIAGAVLGAFGGLIAGTIFRRLIWQPGTESEFDDVSARRV
jgi:outer membrane lipoprotein SlyB